MGDAQPPQSGPSPQRYVSVLSQRGVGKPRHEWPDGQLPNRIYTVVDGFLTQSTPVSWFRPWIEALTSPIDATPPFPGLRKIDAPAIIRGFSYFATGKHYFPVDTTQGITVAVERFSNDYGPRLLPMTYLAFSLGGVVATLGLAASIASQPHNAALVEALILVQPAFRPSREFGGVLPASLISLVMRSSAPETISGNAVLDDVLAKLATITNKYRIPVYLLYWPGDQIVLFEESLLEQLRNAGVVIAPPLQNLQFPGRNNVFQEHCDIAGHESMLNTIAELLRRHFGLPVDSTVNG